MYVGSRLRYMGVVFGCVVTYSFCFIYLSWRFLGMFYCKAAVWCLFVVFSISH